MRDVQVVVVDERHAPAKQRIERAPVDPLQMMLAHIVGRMRLAGKDNLHRPADAVENARQTIRVVKDQLGPLVAGEAPREPNRQRVGIEQRARGDDAGNRDVLFGPPLPRALAYEREQISPQRLAHGPQFAIGNREDGVPERRLVMAIEPVGAKVSGEQRRQIARDPRRHVHFDAAPDVGPHGAGDLAVKLADPVHFPGGPQRERRHVELRTGACIVRSERQEAFAVRAQRAPEAGQVFFDEVKRERIVPGWHRRVRREHRRPSYFVDRFVEGRAALREIADALQDDERGVPLVEVEDRGIGAERLQRAHAADPEDDLLLDARFAIAAVEAGR